MLEFNHIEVRNALDALCEEFDRKGIERDVYIIVVGAASLILKFNLKRATSDIDILEPISASRRLFGGLGQLLSRMGFHIVSETLLNLHPDYMERLEPFERKGKIRVLTLNPYDLAISKIGRGFAKDMKDIASSDLMSLIELKKLESLYCEAMKYWIGDERQYAANWKMFLEDYAEKGQK